jgi:hypothetical protein
VARIAELQLQQLQHFQLLQHFAVQDRLFTGNGHKQVLPTRTARPPLPPFVLILKNRTILILIAAM